MEGCVFCAIAAGQAPAELLCQDAHALAFLDIHPAAPGHTLVIPRRHVHTLCELDEDSGGSMMGLAIRVARALQASLQPDGLSLVQSSGRAAGQEISHAHLHLIPRWHGDGLRLARPAVVRSSQALAEIAQRLRETLQGL